MEQNKNNPHIFFIVLLHISVAFGIISNWEVFLSLEVWIIWFLCHALLFSMYVIYIEFFSTLSEILKKNLLYHALFLVLCYYQRIYVLTNQSAQNYEIGCKRDLLVLTSTVTFTVILLSFSASFTLLIS